jgi:threonine dehydrogenase-like Zn-dependent dehydrogenase
LRADPGATLSPPARLAYPRTMSSRSETDPLRVIVAGAGVAGLEGVLALRDLAAERVRVESL